jgi:hypothetical protein
MVEHRWNHAATLLGDGRVLVVGGGNAAELYDPGTGRWTATGSTTLADSFVTATFLTDGRVLAVGGSGLGKAALYDPATGLWTATGSMAEAHSFHTATLLRDGRVLVVGGYAIEESPCCASLSAAELYDPISGRWTATASMATARQGHSATLLPDGTVLVAGGDPGGDGNPLASAELYDPSRGQWTGTGSMGEARSAFTATLLGDGKVLVAGGRGAAGGDESLASAELYDLNSRAWTATGGMAEARSNVHCGWLSCGHMATLLPDGMVLVAGGGNDPNGANALASAELYDPGSGSWTATASMVVARVGSTATLLLDGTVLVAGGDFSGGPEDLASAELYDPRGGFSIDEADLLAAIRADARVACEPRRVDLPAHAVAGVECSPEVDLVDRIGVYLFTAQDELLETYFDRLADNGVEPRSGSCPKGAGEHAYVPGDSGPTIGPYRYGCYLNEFGNANYRFTVPDSLVYVGILGTGKDLEALHEWAWLGNQDTPGGPTVWRGPAR